MANPQYSESANDIISDVNVRLRDMEEKQNLIKDRVLLIGDNFISEKEETEKMILELKAELNKTNEELKRIKLAIERILEETQNFARRNELEIIQRQFEMFQPLELARISDVENMINNALKKQRQQ